MEHLGPDYLLPNVLFGTVAVVAVSVFGLHRALSRAGLPARERGRAFWSGSALLLAWLIATLYLSWSGFFRRPIYGIPTVPFGLLIPIVAGVALYRGWLLFRHTVDAIPQSWLAIVQFYRVEGLVFLTLYAGGWLPGVFALPAGIGDLAVGLLAPLAGFAYLAGTRGSSGWLRVWNWLGLTDLAVAVTTGFLSSPSPIQLFAHDHPNLLVSAFPLALIPVFLVPLSVLLHLASLARLRREGERRDTRTPLAGQSGLVRTV